MAAAGVASRRKCEELIEHGRVRVDGEIVTEMGTKVDPASVTIEVDGRVLRTGQNAKPGAGGPVYIKLYKPRDVLSDFGGDARDRRTVLDLLPREMRLEAGRVFPVGRLDLISEGLILLTNDGNLAHKLTHPRYEHPKTYYVLLDERPSMRVIEQLRTGVTLNDGTVTAPARVHFADGLPGELQLAEGQTRGVWLQMTLREGKKRQIRHMTNQVGYPTRRLIRWSIGSLELGNLSPGQARPLARAEVTSLRQMVAGKKPAQRKKPSANRSGTNRPGTNRPSTNRPGTNRPSTNRPGTNRRPRRNPTKRGKQ